MLFVIPLERKGAAVYIKTWLEYQHCTVTGMVSKNTYAKRNGLQGLLHDPVQPLREASKHFIGSPLTEYGGNDGIY